MGPWTGWCAMIRLTHSTHTCTHVCTHTHTHTDVCDARLRRCQTDLPPGRGLRGRKGLVYKIPDPEKSFYKPWHFNGSCSSERRRAPGWRRTAGTDTKPRRKLHELLSREPRRGKRQNGKHPRALPSEDTAFPTQRKGRRVQNSIFSWTEKNHESSPALPPRRAPAHLAPPRSLPVRPVPLTPPACPSDEAVLAGARLLSEKFYANPKALRKIGLRWI